jgi:hypothetical protein
MNTRPTPSSLARLMQDLSLREGEDLHRALAQSTALLARLSQYAPRRRSGAPERDVATLERAQRELALLVARELARLCDLAADPEDPAGDAATAGAVPAEADEFLDVRVLVRRLDDELDCAEAIECLPPPLLERVRDLAWNLSRGERDALGFRTAAATLEALAALSAEGE